MYWARMYARVDGAGQLQDAVGERGLAVVDVGDDRQVPDPLDGRHGPIVADDRPNRTTEPSRGASHCSFCSLGEWS